MIHMAPRQKKRESSQSQRFITEPQWSQISDGTHNMTQQTLGAWNDSFSSASVIEAQGFIRFFSLVVINWILFTQ